MLLIYTVEPFGKKNGNAYFISCWKPGFRGIFMFLVIKLLLMVICHSYVPFTHQYALQKSDISR